MTPPEVQLEVQNELAQGEELLWSGQPRQGIFFRGSDALMIPFSLLWGGFAIFWTIGATSAAGAFGLFGIPFMCVGIYFMIGRFFSDASARSRTVYGVTNRRLVIIRTGRRRSQQSVDYANIGSLGLKEQSNGRATITFGPGVGSPMGFQPPANWPTGNQVRQPQFDSIDDGRRVYEMIRDASAART